MKKFYESPEFDYLKLQFQNILADISDPEIGEGGGNDGGDDPII